MKKIAALLLIFGTFATIAGLLPFIFPYPNCQNCEHSGPSNVWELLLMISYEGKGWFLMIGIALLLLSLFRLLKRKLSIDS
ncbi:hypothetical protein [Paenibacillus thermotolerans]|uniref:hypothetical protein n=1 Tax=Paenibacillus thermotolerans TaxID=3027807 RepID=UPI0023675143|nr:MULTISPECIES: hypothetical protein [unclassified Paenibacillus]